MTSTKTLERQYRHLAPEERFPLIAAAAARDDEAERLRLVDSSPRGAWTLPDYHGTAKAMCDLAKLFLMGQLGRVVDFLHAHRWIALSERVGEKSGDTDEGETHRTSILLATYGYVMSDSAWRRFCEEKAVDPEALLAHLPGYPTLMQCDWMLRKAAPTAEEMTELLRLETGDADAVAVTADQVLTEWRRAYREQVAKWR